MTTKKITLNELRDIVKQIIKEENEEDNGLNLRALLDAELSSKIDFSNYKERNKLIDKIEERIRLSDWVTLSNGETFKKSFTPTQKK